MLPSPRSLAAFGLRAALNDIVAAEDRAHAFLASYETPPREREAVSAMLRALDRIDVGAHEFTVALRNLEGERIGGPMVSLAERDATRARPPTELQVRG